MQISRENYECFFIDFIDGKLSPAEEAILLAFARENPDLAEELRNLEKTVLEPNTVHFPKKEQLLHHTNFAGIESRTDYLCIAKAENDITPIEESELLSIIEISSSRDLDLYQKVFLSPSQDITYNRKVKLKRYSLFALNYKQIIAVSSSAAVALILLGVFTFFQKSLSIIPELAVSDYEIPIHKELEKLDRQEPEVSIPTITENNPTNIKNYQPDQHVFAEHSSETHIEEMRFERSEIIADRIPIIEAVKVPLPFTSHYSSEFLAFARFDRTEIDLNSIDEKVQSGAREIGFFELAQMGFNRLASLTGRDINLDAEKDPDGRITKINFETELFALSVPVSKNKN
ncbi:MAG: hypothetical protein RBT74_07580 [Tenuifilaceae bacterium]|jgi:hypothetical protein|nr:hypothetical protein [Bacteroidales bacterium]MDX9846824.1 hypothetical protein [Tenuifilaceae bacterium]